MLLELTKAHQANNCAAMLVYGLNVKTSSEERCVARLFNMYQELVKADKSVEDIVFVNFYWRKGLLWLRRFYLLSLL